MRTQLQLINIIIIISTILLIWLAWADRCQIIEYLTLSDGTYVDLSFIQAILCFYSNIWAVNLIRGLFHMEVSSCWSRVIWAFFCVLWSFHSSRHWWSRGKGWRRYHIGQHTDTDGAGDRSWRRWHNGWHTDTDGAGDKSWWRYPIGRHTDTLGGLSKHVSEICLFY